MSASAAMPTGSARSAPRLFPIGGGKGGVGKTFLVANLATRLARMGRRVIAVDADLEGANLHTCVGLTRPQLGLAEFLAGREEDLGKLVLETGVPGLGIIAATRCNLAAPQAFHARRVEMLRALRRLDADYVLLDLGAGTHPAVMDYYMVGEEGLVVVVPEPTSLENAYAFIRAAFYRRLRLAMLSHEMQGVVELAMDEANERGIRTPLQLLQAIEAADPAEGARFVETMRAFRPQLVLNEVRDAEDVQFGFSIQSVCRKYFGIEANYLGYVNYESGARHSVRQGRPLIELDPTCGAAICIERIARKLEAPLTPVAPRAPTPDPER